MPAKKPLIHQSAFVEKGARIGRGSTVWHFCHIRTGAVLGENVSLGKDVYIDKNVHVGEGTRIQNGVSVYQGVRISRWCFVGPNVTFTNDRQPRAGNVNWKVEDTILEEGASLGAGTTVVCGVRVGAYAVVGAGSLVSRSLPPFHLAVGLPARLTKLVCACAQTLSPIGSSRKVLLGKCCRRNLTPAHYRAAQAAIRKFGRK